MDIRYNHGFSDADEARLVQLAPFANDPQHRYFTCGWVTGHGICSSLVQGPDFNDHLRTHHGVVGPDRAQVQCRWIHCFADMKKESLVRHIHEKHLEVRYACSYCPEQFTRSYTMQQHIIKKHSNN